MFVDSITPQFYACDHYILCAKCGDFHPQCQMKEVTQDEWFCEKCYEEHVRICEDCSYPYDKDTMYEFEDENGEMKYYCSDCYGARMCSFNESMDDYYMDKFD